MVNMRCHRAGLAVAGKEVTVGEDRLCLERSEWRLIRD